jgi:tight adherence protein B
MTALLVLAVAVVALPHPAVVTARLRTVLPLSRAVTRSRRPKKPLSRVGRLAVAAGTGAGVLAAATKLVSAPGSVVLPVVGGAVAGGTVGHVVSTALARRQHDRAISAQVEAIAAVAAEVRAGQRPEAAVAAAGFHATPPAISAMWALSERSGAPVAAVLDRIEDDLRGRVRQRQSVATQLAGARSTALLLACLPAVGIALGAAMGAAPLTVLLGTTGGQLALLAGLALDSAGVLWTARIVAAADGDR